MKATTQLHSKPAKLSQPARKCLLTSFCLLPKCVNFLLQLPAFTKHFTSAVATFPFPIQTG